MQGKDRPEDEREAIRKTYATKGAVLGEAEELIAAKADDMMRHYVEHILPNHLKAQVVAYSRLAAVRYQAAQIAARDKLVKEAEALDDTREQGGPVGAVENDRDAWLPVRCPSLRWIAPEQPNRTPTSAPSLSPPAIDGSPASRRTNARLDARTAPRYGGN
ncbi:MAG: hypothetical protein JNJ46_26430 [Myxococcales bacterium]|nr:hypothetical protein [Myxococcales bacterium]